MPTASHEPARPPSADRGFRRVVDPVDGQVHLYATNSPDVTGRTMYGKQGPADPIAAGQE
ncbi:hypothetical protein LZG04_06520 [Saccharothrix sp. S26]|uniref:hypothetical protein n=1 Tax=Saccharothrix sp. S26 TaxID=2907215 RepID=UPI001F2B8A99|nr:hypothetical protein [Saccharothrix sp. S26]MCE6994462.1 hypothetical protein [Saccharothrix sp. S26]